MDRKHFERLSSHCFEHPLDRKAKKALKNTAGFDRLVRLLIGMGIEPIMDFQNRSNFVRLGPNQCAPVYKLFVEAAKTLDLEPVPPLYLAHSFAVNAWTFGSKTPYVVVTSALVEGFSDEEIQCVMGHELGHVLAGHSTYRTVGMILMMLLEVSSKMAGGIIALPAALITRGLLSALFYWIRCSELTSDRCGLLVAQDPKIAYSTEMKLAGGPGEKINKWLNVDEFMKQAREFDADPESNSKWLRFVLEDLKTHPFPVFRARELQMWVESGAYEEIMGGEYSKRSTTYIAGGPDGHLATDQLSQSIEDVIQMSLSRVFGVYTAPKIPEHVVEKALEGYAQCGDNEGIVAIYEGGTGGSDSVLLSTKKIYYSAGDDNGLSYELIERIDPVSGGFFRSPAIDINGDQLRLTFHRMEVRDGMLDAIVGARRILKDAGHGQVDQGSQDL
jgi:Zn-dependent protease with chaperone function